MTKRQVVTLTELGEEGGMCVCVCVCVVVGQEGVVARLAFFQNLI